MAALKREFQISMLAVVVLVLLRIAVGWHFLHEGITKADQPNFTAEPYLRQAKGPLANWYRNLIPDAYGERRLDIEAMREHWQSQVEAATKHFHYEKRQQEAAAKALAARLRELDDFLREGKTDDFGEPVKEDGKTVREYKPAIRLYKAALERWKENDAKEETKAVPFEQKRHWDKLVELQQTSAPWLAEVDRMDAGFRMDLEGIASAEQTQPAGELPRASYWLDWLEVVTTYSLIGIGLCLMLGFATRLAAVAGAIFLLTAVIFPQLQFGHAYPPPPPSAGNTFLVSKEVIEALSLLFISLTAAGRFAGLDYIGYGLFTRYYDAVGDFIKRYVGKAVGTILQLLQRILRKKKTDEPVS